jgi:hypothetical protein
MRERSYIQRNKRVQLWEVPEVVALQPKQGGKTRRRRGSSQAKSADVLPSDVPQSQVRAFESAGWVFQDRSSAELPAGVEHAKVFVKPGGRVALGTNLLTVQLPGEPSEDKANEVLEPYGVQVAERLTFAPGLFQVAITDPSAGDALEVANRLVDSGLVTFAEPVLIEATGHRVGV